ncbi:hypothetical protein CYMTET_5432 [Cymbomonas tetramitiformis]|uniref:Uncharacterized protein n=1 Tax=Cymbomonas tetramitiformis TaxID=36881 RepID=A0AAE0GZE3_9CHLO|nr:hypothetical protein CYMTET_5432 [Cymbomonas tetramitiformis]
MDIGSIGRGYGGPFGAWLLQPPASGGLPSMPTQPASRYLKDALLGGWRWPYPFPGVRAGLRGPRPWALPVGTLVEVFWPSVIALVGGRNGSRRTTVLGSWSREDEKGLLMGWRRLREMAGGEGRMVGGGDEVGGRAWPLRGALTEHFQRSHPDASNLLMSAAGLTRYPDASCGAILAETSLRQHRSRAGAGGRRELLRDWRWEQGASGRLWGMSVGAYAVIRERCDRFMRGEWEGLFAEASEGRRVTADAGEERVLRDAVRLVKAGQLGKTAKRLELAKLAQATKETLQKPLRRLERLHPAGTGRRREVKGDRRRELQGQALELDGRVFDDVMRNVPWASGPGSPRWSKGMRVTKATKSLQAAMQKVTEAMGEIEEAREAEQHLPPQVPKADDAKKFEVAKSAFPLASAVHDDFAGYLTYSPHNCPDVTVLGAEGLGHQVIFDVATARPMADAHVGAAMMASGAAASKVATYGNVHPHQLVPFGVEVYGGLGPAAVAFLKRTQRRFSGRQYLAEDAAEDARRKMRGGARLGTVGVAQAAGLWAEAEVPVLLVAGRLGRIDMVTECKDLWNRSSPSRLPVGQGSQEGWRLVDGLEDVRQGAECLRAAGGQRVAETRPAKRRRGSWSSYILRGLGGGRGPPPGAPRVVPMRGWLAGARLVALLKDGLSINVRPIACGEVLRKLVAKIGVVVKGGAELWVHTVQAALDQHPEWVRVKADAKNAFNAV